MMIRMLATFCVTDHSPAISVPDVRLANCQSEPERGLFAEAWVGGWIAGRGWGRENSNLRFEISERAAGWLGRR